VADNKQKGTINNNLNVREAIVRPKGDKNINLNNNNTNNINQQHSAGERTAKRSFERSEIRTSPAARSDVSMSARCGLISHDGSNDRSAYVASARVVNVVFNPSPVVNPTPVGNPSPVGCRSAAEIERELTSLILKAQQDHEEIILDVTSSGLA
jgi:hypothetical protein